ncbi:MAG: helix-turn-helix domain-containing protein [Chloroflexi bacterium]|nr:helix-turn-helix domain-containing protein [Chloroflexota bacterium]
MKAAEVRRRVAEKVRDAAAGGDEETVAKIMDYSRAVLLALAGVPDHQDVGLEDVTLGTGTAARILGLHAEYVRELIRRGHLPARKENGEFRVVLPDVLDFMVKRVRSPQGPPQATWRALFGRSYRGFPLWRRPA